MITELMIILIVVGAIIIFVAWTSARRRKRDDDERRDAEDSTEKFKQDLEKTANEIIGRMENQATRLEKLLNNAENSRTQLEGRIAELKKLLARIDRQSNETKDLLARLDVSAEDFDAVQRRSVKSPARQPVKIPISPPNLMTPQPLPSPSKDFAKVLETSLKENPPPKRSEHLAKTAPVRRISEISTQENSESNEFENAGDSAAVREMLLAGMTVEEIARETGMGRGAVLLVQQMMRRKSGNRN